MTVSGAPEPPEGKATQNQSGEKAYAFVDGTGIGLSPVPSGLTTRIVPGDRELENAITLPSGDQVGMASDGGGG